MQSPCFRKRTLRKKGSRKSSLVKTYFSKSITKTEKEKEEEMLEIKQEPIFCELVDQVLENVRETCPFCEKRFDTVRRMELHVKNYHKKPYKCDKCRRSCFTQRALEKHKLVHLPDYYFECATCHRKYKCEGNLKRHEIRSHSDREPNFTCDHCGRQYKQKFDLMVHLKRIHESELQMCHFCGLEVKDIKSHEWRHEKRTRETFYQYPCHLCLRKFHSKNRLDNHLLIHKKVFKCEDCGKEYRGPRELSGHKRKHQQAINTCTICGKVFSSVSNFYQHILTHAGIRPYKCDICDEDFTQRSSLLRHRKNHPGPLPPLVSSNPQIAELARSFLQVLQNPSYGQNSQ